MQKARSQALTQPKPGAALLPLVGMWFQALFHSPHGGAFHLSLTVLVHYRSHGSLKPWRVVPPASRPISRGGRYSGTLLRSPVSRSATGLSPSLAPRSRGVHLARTIASAGPTTPRPQGPRFGLGSVSLAATPDISVDFSSSRY